MRINRKRPRFRHWCVVHSAVFQLTAADYAERTGRCGDVSDRWRREAWEKVNEAWK